MNAKDWSKQYDSNNTRWDLGQSPDRLLSYLKTLTTKQRILIPGCGRGYEIRDCVEYGHEITAIDYSIGAIHAAEKVIGNIAKKIICDDFFTHKLPDTFYDICYERTFLCALPEKHRIEYGERIAKLLKPGGLLIGVFHYGIPKNDSLPVSLTKEARMKILEVDFNLIMEEKCPSGLGVFEEHDEMWQIWRKKS